MKTPKLQPADFGTDGRIRRKPAARLLAQGYKWCPRHNKGKGAVVPADSFDWRGQAKSHQRRGYCKACTPTYDAAHYQKTYDANRAHE